MGRYDLTERKRPWGLIITILIVLLIIGGGVWLYNKPEPIDDTGIKTQELPVPMKPEETAPEAEGGQSDDAAPQPVTGDLDQLGGESRSADPAQGETQEETPAALPSLDNSDSYVRDKIIGLSPGLGAWLKTDGLIRKIIVIVNDFSQGLRLHKHMKSFKLDEPFMAEQDERGLYVTAKSYQRYNALASAIDAVNVPDALALYKTLKPLCQQVFAEFNYPEDYQIDDLIKKAAAEILAAPVIEARIDLVRTSVHYKFADKELEALSPVHKQMIRMGPQNTRIIQNKIRLLLEFLVNMND